MKIATVSLDYYHQDSFTKCRVAGADVKKRNIDFAGFTEVRSQDMRDGLRSGMGGAYVLKGTAESPQGFNVKRWVLVNFHIVLGNKGVAGITPDLYFSVGTYQNRQDPKKFIEIISTHMVPLYGGQVPLDHFDERKRMWTDMWLVLKGLVAAALAKGHTVIVIGDFNNIKAKRSIIRKLHPKAKWIIRHGIDWAFVVESTVKVRKFGLTRLFASGSDHRAVCRNVLFY